jgi:predicted amidohydrolase YtcJ
VDDNRSPGSSDNRDAEKGLSRRQLLVGGAAAGAAVGIGGGALGVAKPARAQSAAGAARSAGRPGSRDLAFVNGKIHTMDGSDRVVSQLLIRDERFAEVGNGIGSPGGNVEVVNLKGRTVVPGLIDSHTHIVLVGNRPGHHVLLEDLFSIQDVVARLRQASADVPAGEFITTIGPVAAMQFPEQRLPNLSELDAVNRPVYIQAAQGGARTNSLGKAWLEARGVAVAADGTVGGSPFASPALQLLRENFLTPEVRERNSLGALQYYTTLGLTTHLDQGAFQTDTPNGAIFAENNYTMYDSFLALDREDKLPARLRINFLNDEEDPALPRLRARLRNAFPFFGNDMLRTGGIGEFTAQGILEEGGPVWLAGTRLVAQARWRNENHSLTQDDFKRIIDAWVQVNGESRIDDLRWVVAHVPFITEDYVDKLKAIGGGLKVGWGPTRTGTKVGPPYRMIVDNGVNVGYHADGGDITVINPWLNFYTMITGRNLRGDLINEGQTLTRPETLRLATAANTWFIGEDDLGSIEVGHHADLVVLDRDYFSVPEAEIARIRSLLTVVGGHVVYDAGVV